VVFAARLANGLFVFLLLGLAAWMVWGIGPHARATGATDEGTVARAVAILSIFLAVLFAANCWALRPGDRRGLVGVAAANLIAFILMAIVGIGLFGMLGVGDLALTVCMTMLGLPFLLSAYALGSRP
jgi:hypothetical protein